MGLNKLLNILFCFNIFHKNTFVNLKALKFLLIKHIEMRKCLRTLTVLQEDYDNNNYAKSH